jgi:hypothetical protein
LKWSHYELLKVGWFEEVEAAGLQKQRDNEELVDSSEDPLKGMGTNYIFLVSVGLPSDPPFGKYSGPSQGLVSNFLQI